MRDILETILNIPEETQNVEFKRLDGLKVVAKVMETIVAMANTDGGSIVIGIDDPEKTHSSGLERIFGIEENKELYDEIVRKFQSIIPPVSGLSTPHEIKVEDIGKTVAVISIPKATECFHSYENHVYIRLKKGNKRLSPQEIIKMSYAKGFKKADKELVDVDFELLDTTLYRQWRDSRKVSGKDIQEILFKTGLARRDDKKLLPTRAAVLLFAEYPTNLMDTKCTIRVLQYNGRIENFRETPNLIGTPVTIEGPLITLIAKAHEYVLTLLRSGIELRSGFITRYQIPERAVKEAITNAVIHRDYHIKRDIEIKIFEDRVEVKNPGLFPYNITKQNIGRVRSDGYRNDLVVKHLREFPQPPNLDQNEGVKAMQNEMNAQNLYPPIYWTYPVYDDSVEVGLFNESRPNEWEKIKVYLAENKYIGNEKAREITGIVQVTKMSRLLGKWTKQGLLTRIDAKNGSKSAIRYKLANQEDLASDH
jgi:ATP-dependent DNA helicase RecG